MVKPERKCVEVVPPLRASEKLAERAFSNLEESDRLAIFARSSALLSLPFIIAFAGNENANVWLRFTPYVILGSALTLMALSKFLAWRGTRQLAKAEKDATHFLHSEYALPVQQVAK